MRSTTWRVAGLLFVSGLCALVYQVAWLREFRLIFGASTAASAAVLAIFIGGLGAGGLLLGGRADRRRGARRGDQHRRSERRRIPGVRALARSLGADRGPVDGAAVFWPGVDTAWTSFNASVGGFGDPSPETTPEERARQLALGLYFERQDMARARESWASQSAPARDITQLAMAADLEADAGSEAAIPLIELHRRFQPAEADVFLATLRWRQGRVEEAADALELALVRLRSDPWPLLRYKEQGLALADAIARRSPALARRMFEALREPFAVGELHEQRLLQSADLTRQLDFATMCRPAVDAFGEHVPWSGNFLALRRDCYQTTRDPRLDVAQRDLNDFLAGEALPLGAGIKHP